MQTANGDFVLSGQDIQIEGITYTVLHSRGGQTIVQCQTTSCLHLVREIEGAAPGQPKHQITRLKPSINVHAVKDVRKVSRPVIA